MKILLAIALKDLRVLARHRPALFWVVGFPLLMAFFFGAIYAGGGGGQRIDRRQGCAQKNKGESIGHTRY